MDETQTYIKMADCPEVQGQRKKFKDGDVLASYMRTWKTVDEDTQRASKTLNEIVIYDDGLTHIKDRNLIVWLPRQDDIQKMMGCVPGNHSFLMGKFVKFDYYHSLEQKWLAFYMHERHKRTWNGNEWVA